MRARDVVNNTGDLVLVALSILKPAKVRSVDVTATWVTSELSNVGCWEAAHSPKVDVVVGMNGTSKLKIAFKDWFPGPDCVVAIPSIVPKKLPITAALNLIRLREGGTTALGPFAEVGRSDDPRLVVPDLDGERAALVKVASLDDER